MFLVALGAIKDKNDNPVNVGAAVLGVKKNKGINIAQHLTHQPQTAEIVYDAR